MLCFVDHPGPAVAGDLSDTDDEVDDDIHSHFNRPPPNRVPKKGVILLQVSVLRLPSVRVVDLRLGVIL
ncbi:hypothetical protein A2U01_0061825, partial [Trifolium medium]|nr:hypothetical protein [Trifolium medium]